MPTPPRGGRDHAHSHDHGHRGHHHHDGHHHHTGHRHPPARPSASLLRLSAWQRLAIVLPVGALLWAAALAVIAGGAP